MRREDIITACARAICDRFDVYEMHDAGATDCELYAETVELLETDPRALLAWLES